MVLTLSDVRPTTKEENELLTTVAAGSPMGETLRRYWWAVGISADLTDKPTLIRVMGEDLVLFRDGTGRPGVLAAHCSHRRVNLCFGTTEETGNVLAALEEEAGIGVASLEFAARASTTISAEEARRVLRGMGILIPPGIRGPGGVDTALRSTPRLSPEQIREFLQAIRP